jgi:hypothetical protein
MVRALIVLSTLAVAAAGAHALERDKEGWYHTGDGIRVKKVAFVGVKVYAIDHYMKELPPQRSKQAVIDAEVDKRITWRMLRTVDAERIKRAMREGFAQNGYRDTAKIEQVLAQVSGDLREGARIDIAYDAASKSTRLTFPTGKTVVSGSDFMHAVWSLWFGKIDQPGLGDALMAQIH